VVIPFIIASAKPAPPVKGPIKIGVNLDLTGGLAETAMMVKRGYTVFLEDKGYKVAGREIKLVEYDNKADPKVSMEVARKLVEMDKVHLMMGFISSATPLPVKAYAEEHKIPTVIAKAGTETLVYPKRSRYVFRTHYADDQPVVPVAHYAYDKLGLRNAAIWGPDWIGGTGKLQAFKNAFEGKGGKVIQKILHPFGTYDFAPYFSTLNPEVQIIYVFQPGDIGVVRFYSQYFDFGLDKKGIAVAGWYTMTEEYNTIKLFGDKVIGFYSGGMYAPSFESPVNARFKELYAKKYLEITNCQASAGWDMITFIYHALAQVKGNVEDTEAFLTALQNAKVRLPCSEASFDANGNVVRDVLLIKIDKKDGVVQGVVQAVYPQVKMGPQGSALMPK
jgi:branched-chain amino acid transport system substrate-binding protein